MKTNSILIFPLFFIAFRAQLVMNESGYNLAHKCQSRLSEHSTWAYNQDQVIEKGSIILSGVKQEYGFGLRQQYFHKSVLMVLDHNSSFTKAIILNRPTSSSVADKNGNNWNIWYATTNYLNVTDLPVFSQFVYFENIGSEEVHKTYRVLFQRLHVCMLLRRETRRSTKSAAPCWTVYGCVHLKTQRL